MVVVAGILAVGATRGRPPGARARPTPSRAHRSPASRSPRRSSWSPRSRSASTAPTSWTATRSAAVELLTDAHAAVERASGVGVAEEQLAAAPGPDRAAPRRALPGRARRRGDRRSSTSPPRSTTSTPPTWSPPATARCGSSSSGRGRILRADPADGERDRRLPRRAGARDRGDAGRPVADRDGGDRRGRGRPAANGVADRPRRADPAPHAAAPARADVSSETTLIGALQHRPPLEIFNLYVVDGATGAHPALEPAGRDPGHLSRPGRAVPDRGARPRPARRARPARRRQRLAAARATPSRASTSARRATRPTTRSTRRPTPTCAPSSTTGCSTARRSATASYLYVFDAANDRIIAFQRADGAFVRQWMAADADRAGVLARRSWPARSPRSPTARRSPTCSPRTVSSGSSSSSRR